MLIRNLVIGDQWIEGSFPDLGARLPFKRKPAGAGDVCSALLNGNEGALRELVEGRQFPVNTALRVSAVYLDKMAHVWRTPLELAIETDAADNALMVDYLIEKGAQITYPALRIALMVIDRNLSGLELGHTRAKDPSYLFNALSGAGAQWGDAVEGPWLDGDHTALNQWDRIRKYYKAQEVDVNRRLDALISGTPPERAPTSQKTRIRALR